MSNLLPNVARAITLGVSFAFNVLVARALGASVSGNFFTAVIVITFVGMIGRFGTDLYALKHASVLRNAELTDRHPLSLPWLTRLCLLGSAALAGILFLAGPALLDLYRPESGLGSPLRLLAISIPFQGYAILNSAVLRAIGRAAEGAFAEMGLTQGLAGLGILVVWRFGTVTSDHVAIAFVCGSVATAAYSWFAVRIRLGKHVVHDRLEASTRRKALGEMGNMTLSSVLFLSLAWLPILGLWIASSPAQVAFFVTAARLSTMLNLIPTIQMTAVLPRVAELFKAHKIDEINVTISRVNRHAAVLAVPSGLIMLFGAEPLMKLFGPEFVAAVPALRVLAVGQVIVVLLGSVNPIMIVVGQERAAVMLILAALLVGAPLTIWFSFLWGALGSSIATSAATLAFCGGAVCLLRRRNGIIAYLRLRTPPDSSRRTEVQSHE